LPSSDRLLFVRAALLHHNLPLPDVADRLGISIDTLYRWVPSLQPKGDAMTTSNKPRLIGYARVSTLDQDPQHQIKVLKAAGCTKIFTDQASGSNAERAQLKRALNWVRGGDTLVVWSIDRLGRSLHHLIEIVNDLSERGVALRFLTQGIDTENPMGRMVFSIMGALAQFERDLISERTKLAAARRKAKKQKWGRPTQFSDPKRVEYAKTLLRSNLPMDTVAKRLGMRKESLYKWFPGGDPDRFGQGLYGASLNPVLEHGPQAAPEAGP